MDSAPWAPGPGLCLGLQNRLDPALMTSPSAANPHSLLFLTAAEALREGGAVRYPFPSTAVEVVEFPILFLSLL